MCEEVRDPVREVPRALAWSIPIGFLTGILFLLPLVSTLPDISMLLAGMTGLDNQRHENAHKLSRIVPSGQPIGVLFTTIMGSKGGGFGMVCIECS
jgi:amino acid transporter